VPDKTDPLPFATEPTLDPVEPGGRPTERETLQAPDEPPQIGGTTDRHHRAGRPRWEIARVSKEEWERALAANDQEMKRVRPGSTEFVRLMDVRGRLCLPPPPGASLEEVDRFARARLREHLAGAYPAPAPAKAEGGRTGIYAVAAVVLLAIIGALAYVLLAGTR
jgi:hypothetical protein